jgi:methionine-rich copper-binding protein CopC
MVTWTASGEQEIEKYEVERSADKSLFTGIISTVSEKGDGPTTYSKTDISPLPADNYYRIKSTGKDGKTIFSNVVKVAAPVKAPEVSSEGTISVSPNPITGKTLQLRFNNEPAGQYNLQLLNSLGQVLQTNSVVIDGNGKTVSISLGASVNAGQYQIKFVGPGGKTTQQGILVE